MISKAHIHTKYSKEEKNKEAKPRKPNPEHEKRGLISEAIGTKS